MSSIKRIENGRASYAFGAVTDVKTKKNSKEYRSVALKFPFLIKNNGLANALAFVLASKEKKGYSNLAEHIVGWVKENEGIDNLEELVEKVLAMDTVNYMLYTKEIMKLALWLKRFAEGLISKDASKKQRDENGTV